MIGTSTTCSFLFFLFAAGSDQKPNFNLLFQSASVSVSSSVGESVSHSVAKLMSGLVPLPVASYQLYSVTMHCKIWLVNSQGLLGVPLF